MIFCNFNFLQASALKTSRICKFRAQDLSNVWMYVTNISHPPFRVGSHSFNILYDILRTCIYAEPSQSLGCEESLTQQSALGIIHSLCHLTIYHMHTPIRIGYAPHRWQIKGKYILAIFVLSGNVVNICQSKKYSE